MLAPHSSTSYIHVDSTFQCLRLIRYSDLIFRHPRIAITWAGTHVSPILPLDWPDAMYRIPENAVLPLCLQTSVSAMLIRYFDVRHSLCGSTSAATVFFLHNISLAIQIRFFEFPQSPSHQSLLQSFLICQSPAIATRQHYVLPVVFFASVHPTVETRFFEFRESPLLYPPSRHSLQIVFQVFKFWPLLPGST